MSDEEQITNAGVQATNNSTAVGKIGVGGSIEGDVNIGGVHYHYETPKDARLPFQAEKIDTEPETVPIPAGPFLIGIKEEDIQGLIEKFGGDKDPYKNEAPQPTQEISLPAYRIGKYPVTNAQYKEFVDKSKREERPALITPIMGWDDSLNIPEGKEDFPVMGVTWYQAIKYCQWLKEKTGRNYQLPNEAQWEKACRGGMNYLFPWGDQFDDARCNHGNSELAPVGEKQAQNGYAVFDFVGNIRQWTCSLWGTNFLVPDARYAYPWKNESRRHEENANSQIRRVVRGSSFNEEQGNLRCTIRRGELPDEWVAGIGFRVVIVE